MEMERYVCIHCHFYQPPRENPWLEGVELQDSAYPYHDWNERITAECYAPNGASRILNGSGRITKIVNNYARISFNFGPTLLSWMEKHSPSTYERILEADALSQQHFSGHGSALAQAYNHMILPLATRRDKHTQIYWGIRDFRRRFQRDPEGMWLPETAVDLETLDTLAEHGIRFTILAPHQAMQVRARHSRQWKSVEGGKIDPTRAYLCHTRAGRKITVFFYDGPISRAVAFEKLLASGETFAQRLLSGFDEERKWPQLMHIATDGETYGHHHAHGDMALAYALEYIDSQQLARITNYGEYLEKHPPAVEAEIMERTAWSCAHGVGRWELDCGCNSGGHAGWTQQWRAPLRQALDWLREDLAGPYHRSARQILKNPQKARDEYISVVLDRSPENVDRFLDQHALRPLNDGEQVRALKLLEMQRYLMLMYTSCGWFFDELTGIETVQVIQYAGRAVQLGQELFGDRREREFIERLSLASSNIAGFGNGADVYSRFVKPAMVTLLGAAAHYAISSIFSEYPERSQLYAYEIERIDSRTAESGRAQLVLGQAQVSSRITREQLQATYGVLHFGDHNLNAGVRDFRGQDAYNQMVQEATSAFTRADFPECIRAMDRHFGGVAYSLRSLFRDEQRRALEQILQPTRAEADHGFQQLYTHHAPLLRFLADIHQPAPQVLRLTAEIVINNSLRHFLDDQEPDYGRIRKLLDSAEHEGVSLDSAGLEFVLRQRILGVMEALAKEPESMQRLRNAHTAIAMARSMPFIVNLWQAQNIYYDVTQKILPQQQQRGEPAREWVYLFLSMGDLLGVEIASPVLEPAVTA
jgi:alpha-amylase/alpha-mannosidase (GH57 family)